MTSTIFKIPTCPVCYNEFDNNECKPRLLVQCGHLLCESCLKALYTGYTLDYDTTFSCFKCKCEYTISPKGKEAHEHFPVSEKILQMIQPVNELVECKHQDILPEQHICLNPKCINKNKFCMLCKHIIHFNCSEELVFPIEQYTSRVCNKDYKSLKIDNQSFKDKPCADLIEDLMQIININLDHVNPKTLNEYLERYAQIQTEVKKDKIVLSFKNINVYNNMIQTINETDFENPKEVIALLISLAKDFAFADLKYSNIDLFNLLNSMSIYKLLPHLNSLCDSSKTIYDLQFGLIKYFQDQKLSRALEREINCLERVLVDTDKEIKMLQKYYIDELEVPFKEVIEYEDKCKMIATKSPQNSLNFVSLNNFRGEIRNFSLENDWFDLQMKTNCVYYFTKLGKNALMAVIGNFDDADQQFIRSLILTSKEAYMTNQDFANIRKKIHKLNDKTIEKINAVIESKIPVCYISHLSFKVIIERLNKKNRRVARKLQSAVDQHKCFYLNDELWEKLKLELNTETCKEIFKKYDVQNKAFLVSINKFKDLISDVSLSENSLKNALNKANKFKEFEKIRLNGKTLTLSQIDNKTILKGFLTKIETSSSSEITA